MKRKIVNCAFNVLLMQKRGPTTPRGAESLATGAAFCSKKRAIAERSGSAMLALLHGRYQQGVSTIDSIRHASPPGIGIAIIVLWPLMVLGPCCAGVAGHGKSPGCVD